MSFPEIRMRRLGLTAAAAVAAMALTGAVAAQSMVVRSTGPSATKYPIGTKFKAGERLTLADGDKVVLMQSGKTRTLSGKGTFNANATVVASQSMGETVTRMIAKRPPTQTRGGASRGPATEGAIVRAPNLWVVDYREGGTFCVADPAMLLLWRPTDKGVSTITVAGPGPSGNVQIPDDSQMRKWPANVPLQYGVDYSFSGGGLTAPVTVRFTPVETLPQTPDASYELLTGKGCTSQVERLVDAMSQAETESATG